MSIGVEEYGYPQVDILGLNRENGTRWIRITQGWFMWDDEDEHEPATYIDLYVNQEGEVTITLDNPMIHFDFETPLDDYTLGGHSTMTIGEWYKEYGEEKHELECCC